MQALLKSILKPLFNYVTNKNYRIYYRLLSAYSRDKRYTRRTMELLGYTIEVSDAISVVHQFKEMFIDELYKFAAGKDNPLIYDCGANVGLSCLYFRKLYPHCSIKAFEADPQICDMLRGNIERNIGSSNIEILNKAVWTDDEGVEFSQEGADGGKVTFGDSTGKKGMRVASVRLKNLLENEKPDFLKMDIEGSEIDVLLDCSSSLSNVQMMFVEYHSVPDRPQRLHALLALLRETGFRYFIQSPIEFGSPFDLPWRDLNFDLQLNIYCYRPSPALGVLTS